MPITPTNILSLPTEYLRTLITNVSVWQEWLGVDGDADPVASAKLKTHIAGTPAPANGRRYSKSEIDALHPFAIIAMPPEGDGLNAYQAGGGNLMDFDRSGRLLLSFEDTIDPDHSPEEAYYTFLNRVGAVLDGMTTLSGDDDGSNQYLPLRSIELFEGPMQSDVAAEESAGRYYYATLMIGWGFEQ